MQSQTGSSNQI